MDTFPILSAGVGVIGAVVVAVFVLRKTAETFYRAPMPEVANRAAFWLATFVLYLIAATLVASSQSLVMAIGTLGLIGINSLMIYGTQRHRLVDVRDALFVAVRTVITIGLAWVFIFALLYFSNQSQITIFDIASQDNATLLLAALAFAVALLIVPVRLVISVLFQWLVERQQPSLAVASALYTQRVARAASLEEVVNATAEILAQVMPINKSALILINNTFRVKNAVELIVLEHGASLSNPTTTGYLSKDSPIYHTLSITKVPVGQFDIAYGAYYRHADEKERKFFAALGLAVYVPVLAEGRLIGLVAAGVKTDDTSYYRADIELLTVIAQQVGTALRSARLIDDLQHLNDSMRVLNKRLENAKVELEKLDDIKTDFITIASHELRTPLAQIRGYTDILDSLNEAGALEQSQTNTMVKNLRKSTERMEELISAMLDVSQIDVNSMDLRFVQTSPETIVKMAIEPLKDPASQRNITIERGSFAELPRVEADLQRMTQAVRNLVLNAIKFTPDGGRIDISAEIEPATDDNKVDHILFKIQDSGVGIAEKDLEYIFQKFYRAFDTQLHSTGIYKFMGAGPGLGLTIAKGIVEGHGGTIWVESPGHDMETYPGSTFYVRIPIVPPEGARRVQPFIEDGDNTRANAVQASP